MRHLFLLPLMLMLAVPSSAKNPFEDIFGDKLNTETPAVEKPVEKPVKEKTARQRNLDEINKSSETFPDRKIDLTEFFYMLQHKKHGTIRQLYIEAGRKIPYIDFMQEYDGKHVTLLGIDQTIIVGGSTFICHCACVDKRQWNMWKAPARYKIRTKFNIGVDGTNTSMKCNCGCNERNK